MSEGTEARRVLPVRVYSDYTCPWCYIGSARLERLERELGGAVELQVEWMPLEIHPEVPQGGMPVEDLPYPRSHWERMLESLRIEAEAEGLQIARLERVANTHRALLASAYVQDREPERFGDFHAALFRAYFGEGRDIGSPAVLREIASEAEVDARRMDDALEQGGYEAALRRTSEVAGRLGITGTPTFVFGERHGAVGAQPVEELRRVVERALAERP